MLRDIGSRLAIRWVLTQPVQAKEKPDHPGANRRWTADRHCSVPEFCKERSNAEEELIFLSTRDHQIDEALKAHITRQYHLPESYFTLLYLRSNGFAFCEKVIDNDGQEAGFSLYFRFLIKHVKHSTNGDEYRWDEMAFLLYLSSKGTSTSIFIDCPAQLEQRIISMYPAKITSAPFETMVKFLNSLITEIVVMYDDAVWSMRDVIRFIEKDRTKDPKFADIHNQARHAIHISEVLEVAVTTVKSLRECIAMASDIAPSTISGSDISQSFAFKNQMQIALQMLSNVELRSRAIEKRFLNEINLAFNLVSQRDSISMKFIAVLTLSFLPATFVSTIFGMAFFDTSLDTATGQNHWVVAKEFWVYWAVAIPLTLFTLTLWKYWTPQPIETTKGSKNVTSDMSKRISTRFALGGRSKPLPI